MSRPLSWAHTRCWRRLRRVRRRRERVADTGGAAVGHRGVSSLMRCRDVQAGYQPAAVSAATRTDRGTTAASQMGSPGTAGSPKPDWASLAPGGEVRAGAVEQTAHGDGDPSGLKAARRRGRGSPRRGGELARPDQERSVWVPRTLSRQATHTYSCRRPQDRSGSDPPVGKGRAGMIWAWREKLQHPMWSPTVVVGTVPGEDGPAVPFTEDHQGDRAVDVNKSTANGVSTRALQHVGSAGGPPQRDPRRWQAGPTRRRCTTLSSRPSSREGAGRAGSRCFGGRGPRCPSLPVPADQR